MMKKILKVIFGIVICLILIGGFNIKSYAISISDIFGQAESFVEKGKDNSSGGNAVEIDTIAIRTLSSFIYNILLALVIVTDFIVAMVLGIKYMTGSVEGKADIKSSLVPFVVISVIAYSAFGIWKIAVTTLESSIN